MNIWFPPDDICRSHAFIHNSRQFDLHEQQALYGGTEIRYTQLSPGCFDGLRMSALLGDVAINMEYCNRTVEKDIYLSPHDFSIRVILDDPVPLTIYVAENSRDWIHVIPPGGGSLVITPKDGTVMVLTIKQDALLHCAGLVSEMIERFRNVNKRGDFVKSPGLTSQLRDIALLALESATAAKNPHHRKAVDQGILLNVETAFTLEWLKQNDLMTFRSTPAY